MHNEPVNEILLYDVGIHERLLPINATDVLGLLGLDEKTDRRLEQTRVVLLVELFSDLIENASRVPCLGRAKLRRSAQRDLPSQHGPKAPAGIAVLTGQPIPERVTRVMRGVQQRRPEQRSTTILEVAGVEPLARIYRIEPGINRNNGRSLKLRILEHLIE